MAASVAGRPGASDCSGVETRWKDGGYSTDMPGAVMHPAPSTVALQVLQAWQILQILRELRSLQASVQGHDNDEFR